MLVNLYVLLYFCLNYILLYYCTIILCYILLSKHVNVGTPGPPYESSQWSPVPISLYEIKIK
jgi:hypothetical protein